MAITHAKKLCAYVARLNNRLRGKALRFLTKEKFIPETKRPASFGLALLISSYKNPN